MSLIQGAPLSPCHSSLSVGMPTRAQTFHEAANSPMFCPICATLHENLWAPGACTTFRYQRPGDPIFTRLRSTIFRKQNSCHSSLPERPKQLLNHRQLPSICCQLASNCSQSPSNRRRAL